MKFWCLQGETAMSVNMRVNKWTFGSSVSKLLTVVHLTLYFLTLCQFKASLTSEIPRAFTRGQQWLIIFYVKVTQSLCDLSMCSNPWFHSLSQRLLWTTVTTQPDPRHPKKHTDIRVKPWQMNHKHSQALKFEWRLSRKPLWPAEPKWYVLESEPLTAWTQRWRISKNQALSIKCFTSHHIAFGVTLMV